MSMPHFPEEALDITCQQAFNMLLGSIAMEELALSHILNAEGEKLQYILGTLPGRPCACTSPKEVLEVNQSVSEVLERVAYNQLLLKGKLRQVVDAKALCQPPQPPAPPCPCLFRGERGRLWHCGRPLPWRQVCGGEGLCWQGCSPALLHLRPGRPCLVSLSLRLSAQAPCTVRLALLGGGAEPLWCGESTVSDPLLPVCLSGCALLTPERGDLPLQLVLRSPATVTVEQAALSLAVTG